MRHVARWLRHEPVLKLVSLIMAVLLWAWRSSESNPEEERKFTMLPLQWENLARDLTVVTQPPAIDVMLRGPRRTLDRLQAESLVQPAVDLAEISQPTWRSLPVEVDVPDNVTVRTVVPDQVEIEIDQFETAVKPVRAELRGTAPPAGYFASPARLSTETAQVRGPRKLVSRVAWLAAAIDLSQRQTDYSSLTPLRPVDSEGRELAGVEAYPREVAVKVEIHRLEEQRTMKVVAPVINGPAAGFTVGEIRVAPPEVKVQGSAGSLGELGEALTTTPIDLGEAKATVRKKVSLVIPQGIMATPDSVEVEVRIHRLEPAR